MSSEDLVGRLRTVEALIGKWREEVNERAGQGCGCYGRSTQLRLCADQLEAALRPLLQETQKDGLPASGPTGSSRSQPEGSDLQRPIPSGWADSANSARGLCESEARKWESSSPKTAEHWQAVAMHLGALYLTQDHLVIRERRPVSAGDLLSMEYVGAVACPTPSCTYRTSRHADVVDIGSRRFVICQECGAHQGYTGWSLDRIRATYAENDVAMDKASSTPRVPLSDEGKAIGSATNSSSLSPSETPEGYPGLFSCGQCAEKLWAPTALPAGPCIRCGSYKWMPLPSPPS
jgi:hypothetical protein